MTSKGLTSLLLLASFIMLALIAVKIIENKDKIIRAQKIQLLKQDSLLIIQNYELQKADSIFQAIPSYFPSEKVINAYWEH